ncbi:MAG: aminoacyl-tRNA hydrolase [Puniceicoccales bacterium]|jgi:PTH1 family peptidyl-tRNA hydrolase|nr:aminoacyl-tRNA hydrolase [Puniceicoccales bacterium]
MAVKLLVGLGNPGREYDLTRHNIGFHVLDKFCAAKGGTWKLDKKLRSDLAIIRREEGNLILAKPLTFMNESGQAVQRVCRFFKIYPAEVVVVCDDISFELGEFKLTERSGSAGHNGLLDILSNLGPGFLRFRIGVGTKKYKSMDLKDHVLGKFSAEEQQTIQLMLPEILCNLQLLLDKGLECSMNLTNRKKNYGKKEELQG